MEIIITNNPQVEAQYQSELKVELLDADLLGILISVRDKIHSGHRLLTHPLSGSIKPNETPYKSVLLSEATGKTDLQSVSIIEECIITAQKFPKKQILKKHLYDLQNVDLALIQSAL